MAAFEAEGEDRESVDLCDEPGQDDEPSLGSTAGGWADMMDRVLDTADDVPDFDKEPSDF